VQAIAHRIGRQRGRGGGVLEDESSPRTSEQAIYQFMSAGINYYCPDQRPVVDSLAGQPQVSPAPVGAPLPAEQG